MKKAIYLFLFIFLFLPLLGYLYKEVLQMPSTIIRAYAFVVFLVGINFILRKNITCFPQYLWLLFFYAVYRLTWLLILPRSVPIPTFIWYGIYNFSTLLIIVIIYNTEFSEKFIRKSIIVIKWTIIFAFAATIIQVFDRTFLTEQTDEYFSMYTFRRYSIFNYVDPNELGLSFIPLASVFIGYQLNNNKKQLIFLFMVGAIAALSNTRYVMFGFLIITFQYIIYKKVKITSFFKYIFISFLVGLSLYFLLNYFNYDFYDWYNTRLLAEGSIEETTRYKAIDNFYYFYPQNPIFGTGVHITEEILEASAKIGSSQIHVGYLSHLVSYGIVGSILLFGFWFTLAKSLFKNAKRTNYWGSFLAFAVFLWAQATLVNYSILFTGIIFALIFDKYYRDKDYQKNLLQKPIVEV